MLVIVHEKPPLLSTHRVHCLVHCSKASTSDLFHPGKAANGLRVLRGPPRSSRRGSGSRHIRRWLTGALVSDLVYVVLLSAQLQV
jgi:hypothetical protein